MVLDISKMMQHRLLFLVLALMCGKQIHASSDNEKLVEAINGFGINLYKELIKTNDNLICSGFSVDTVLNMILAGARNTTKTELLLVLGYQANGLSDSQIKDAYHDIIAQQRNKKSGYKLDVANSIWIQQGFSVLPDFKKIIRDTFYAEEQEVNFAVPQATDTINNWVSKETNGKIPKLFDEPLTADTRLVLANAMYFKGSWVTKFNATLTKDEAFTHNDGKTKSNIPMMNVYSNFPYTESEELNAQLLELPYDGKEVSMYVFLPKSNVGLTSLQQQLTQEKVKNAIGQVRKQKVHVKFPKFKSSSTLALSDILKNLGIKKVFNQAEADLSGIDGKKDLYVSKVVQKAIIEVSEEGTVAAAATGAVIAVYSSINSPPKEIFFTADHPFLYFIVHKPTGLTLFTGRLVKP